MRRSRHQGLCLSIILYIILVVWVNHLINLKVQFIISKSQKIKEIKNKEKQSKKEDSLEVLSWGSRYVLSSYGPGLLRASLFIFMGCCVWKACVCDPVNACGDWREKMCESCLGDNSDILGICVSPLNSELNPSAICWHY